MNDKSDKTIKDVEMIVEMVFSMGVTLGNLKHTATFGTLKYWFRIDVFLWLEFAHCLSLTVDLWSFYRCRKQ